MFAHDLGIDVWEAIDAASTKPFGYMRFTPGPGRRRPLPADRPVLPVLAGAADARPELPLRRAGQRHQRPHAGLRGPPAGRRAQPARARRSTARRILLLGLAYKKNTGDARESPAAAGRRAAAGHGRRGPRGRPARGRGRARRPPASSGSTLTAEELAAADAVVLLADHDAFDLDLVRPARPVRARHPPPPDRIHRRVALAAVNPA